MRHAVGIVILAACGGSSPHHDTAQLGTGAGCPSDRQVIEAKGTDWVSAEKEEDMDITIPPYDPLHGAGVANQLAASFRGKDRAGAKTSIVGGEPDDYDSVAELEKNLKSDAE